VRTIILFNSRIHSYRYGIIGTNKFPFESFQTMKTKIFTFGDLEIRFNWAFALFVLVVFSGFVRLGIWQMSRAQEKMALQETYNEMGEGFATPIDDVEMSGLQSDALNIQNLHVSMTGEFMNDRSLFLIYQTYEDTLGYEVVTPFKLQASEKIVFVSRGWVNANTYEGLKERVTPIIGVRSILGQLFVPTPKQAARTNIVDLSSPQWPLEIRFMNTLELAPLFEESFFPYEVRLDEGQPGIFIRHWPTVYVDTARNFSYALQWFSMSLALLIVTLVLSSNILQLMQKRSKSL
jgi:surfeit locus 1 family protein